MCVTVAKNRYTDEVWIFFPRGGPSYAPVFGLRRVWAPALAHTTTCNGLWHQFVQHGWIGEGRAGQSSQGFAPASGQGPWRKGVSPRAWAFCFGRRAPGTRPWAKGLGPSTWVHYLGSKTFGQRAGVEWFGRNVSDQRCCAQRRGSRALLPEILDALFGPFLFGPMPWAEDVGCKVLDATLRSMAVLAAAWPCFYY